MNLFEFSLLTEFSRFEAGPRSVRGSDIYREG